MRTFLAAATVLLTMSATVTSAKAVTLPFAEILDAVNLPVQSSDGQKIKELSGFAWDADEKILYAVSDNGYLHHFKLSITNDKISEVNPFYSTSIADSAVGLQEWHLTNAEGLHVRNGDNGTLGDSELLIAFEDGPSIARFTPQGKFLSDEKLPSVLADQASYRNPNKRLESVSELTPHGIITAPEAYLESEANDMHSIFAIDGKTWHFQALQSKQDSVKAIDPLPENRLFVLVRTRDANTDEPQAHLRIVDLKQCGEVIMCPATEVGVSDPSLLANDFEGMTAIGDGLYVIVTDARHGGEMVLFRLKL
jgi:Esterase-like activity of phytase